MPSTCDKVEVEEVVVGRHVKMRSELGGIDVHASNSALGVWISPKGAKSPCGQIGIFVQHGRACLSLYPDYPTNCVPFAISTAGLQVVKRDGTVRIVPLDVLADIVDGFLQDGKSVDQKPVPTYCGPLNNIVRCDDSRS